MKKNLSLPEPSPDARKHSENLISRIREEIESANETDATSLEGSISFRRYMEMALYEPGLGYYVAGSRKIGAQGDFVTAPEISPFYSQCIAQQCKQVLEELKNDSDSDDSKRDILELGAGSGIMATDILLELEKHNSLPDNYYILDLSPDLKLRQKETLEKYAPHLITRVNWLSQLPEKFNGIILGNEVLDAMPVDVFTQQGNKVFEHHVIWETEDDGLSKGQKNQLREQLRPASIELTEKVLNLKLPLEATPYTSELNPNLSGWFDSLSMSLQSGVILLMDYGYPRSEYYLPERNKGTLICHYQHLVNESPLHHIGLQDITASVDFTAVAEAADDAGFKVEGFTSQAAFLANTNIETLFMQALDKNPDDQYKLAQQIRTLSLPSEMGERFKFIALSKQYNKPLQGFSNLNQLHRL